MGAILGLGAIVGVVASLVVCRLGAIVGVDASLVVYGLGGVEIRTGGVVLLVKIPIVPLATAVAPNSMSTTC